MKQIYLILGLMLCINSYATQPQQHKTNNSTGNSSYITKIYHGFKLEKFPTKYVAHPVRTETNTFRGKLVESKQVNALGNSEGFYLSMFNWECPETVTYYLGENWVYQAKFFPNSKVIESVENYDLKHNLRGWQIKRVMNDDERSFMEHNVFIDNDGIMTVIDNKKLSSEDIQLQKAESYDRDALCNKYDGSGTIRDIIFVSGHFNQL